MQKDFIPAAPVTSFEFILRSQALKYKSPEPHGTYPTLLHSETNSLAMPAPKHGRRLSRRALAQAGRRMLLPLLSPIAWRTRTFLSKPQHEIETRLVVTLNGAEARLAAQIAELRELVRSSQSAAADTVREQRKLFVSIRNLVEVQSSEIARLEIQLAQLQFPTKSGV